MVLNASHTNNSQPLDGKPSYKKRSVSEERQLETPFVLTKSKIITCKQVPKPRLSAFKELTRISPSSSRSSSCINEPYGKHVGDHKVKLRKSSKFTHAANLLDNSTDSSEEEIKANFETLVTSNRLEASVEGNDDDKKGKKMKRQNRIIAENQQSRRVWPKWRCAVRQCK